MLTSHRIKFKYLLNSLALTLGLFSSFPAQSYTPHYQTILKSLYLAHDVDVYVVTPKTYFFELTASGERPEDKILSQLKEDDVDISLGFNGRVKKNIRSIFRDRLENELKITTLPFSSREDGSPSPYRLTIDVLIVQGYNVFNKTVFSIWTNIYMQESATAASGRSGYIDSSRYTGVAVASTKREIEGKLYEALERAWQDLSKNVTEARKHCAEKKCL